MKISVFSDHVNDFSINYNSKLLTEYDYYSIMHYKINQFSKFALMFDTIRIKQPGVDETKVGQRDHISDKDKEKISILYQCQKSSRTAQSGDLKTWQGLTENTLRPTTNKQYSAFGVIEGDGGNANKDMHKSQVLDNVHNEAEGVITPSKPTVKTTNEVVSVLNISTRTSKQDTHVNMTETETANIGKK